MRRAKLAAPADVVMLLLSCRGSSHKRRKTNRLCAFAGLLLSEAAVAPGTHPPVGRKRGGWRGKQEPSTGLLNPAVNPRPCLPTTSHYLCTAPSARTVRADVHGAALTGQTQKGRHEICYCCYNKVIFFLYHIK